MSETAGENDATSVPALLRAIGNTPLVELTRLPARRQVRIMAKLEGSNPGGSVKDRPAWWMIRAALARGELRPGKTILEPTSGNTGIGVAMVAAALGYPVTLTLPENVSVERRQVLKAYGAELVLTPFAEKTDGAIRRAHQLYEQDPERYFMPNQFANPDNWRAHYESTAPEILQQTGGEVHAFVGGMGTTGTLMGVARRLEEHDPKIAVVGAEPLLGHRLQGLKNMQEAIVPAIFEPERLDRVISVPDEPAFETTRRLAREEGIFCGMSSGAALWAALQLAEDLPAGSTIVVLLPDRGDRYLSTDLYGGRE